jgi:FTR1 family protein
MLSALTSTLREGLSAFLVIGVLLAIFRRAGERHLIHATRWGIAGSLVTTLIAAGLFSQAANQALWEGVLALAAAAGVAWMGVHLWRTTRGRGERHQGTFEALATVCLTILMVTRGTMEIALLVGTMLWQVPALEVLSGAAVGTALAFVLAWSWARYGRRMVQPYFRQVTTMFVCVFFLQLLVDGFNEMAEANLVAGAASLQRATAPFSSDGAYGQYAPYLLIAVPLVWWLLALFLGHGKASTGRVAHLER